MHLFRQSLVPLLLLGTLLASAEPVRSRRLPPGYHQGRCLYVVDGKARIAGRCAYRIEKGGDFRIDGPRQTYDGIDYPRARITAEERSADYWANVFREDGGWTGYGNEDVREVHGNRRFGPLRRDGACFVGKGVKICLWRR
jgi:hypothetical protein